MRAKKNIIIANHSNLPKAIGPYSHSTRYGNLIFISGQIGLEANNNILKQGIEEQTVQIFENLKAVLENNHSDLKHVTKSTIYVTDINSLKKSTGSTTDILVAIFRQRVPFR